MHSWGDKGVDWKGIGEAASFIAEYCRKYGRLGGPSKEKYGTVRFYASFGWLSLHTLIYPGYSFSRFPNWLWKLDVGYIGPTLDKLFGRLFIAWQKKVYDRAYQEALRRWPHLRPEILCGADHVEYITGATVADGDAVHVVDWDGRILSTWSKVGN